jgi:hypothetical protein
VHNRRYFMMTEEQAKSELAAFAKRRDEEHAKVQEEYSAKWTPEKRKQALKDGDALPGDPPKFPIKDQEDMDNANNLRNNSTLPQSLVIRHMKKQARKHGLKLPASLQGNSSS